MSRGEEKVRRPDRMELIARFVCGSVLGTVASILAATQYNGPGWQAALIVTFAALACGYWATRDDWWTML